MATVIDALVVTLGLDPKDFKRGQKAVDEGWEKTKTSSKKSAGEVERAGKKAAESIASLRNEVLRMAAVFVGLSAIKNFVSSVTRSDAALGRMARGMDTSIDALSMWKNVANQAGVSGDALVGDLANLSQSIQRFSLTGEGGEAFRYFRALGVMLTDTAGKMRPFDDVLREVATKFQGMDPAKARALGAGMGFSTDTVDLLLQGRAKLDAALVSAKKNALNDEDTRSARERNQAWQELTQTFGRIARDILNDVTPAMVGLLTFIEHHAGPAAAIMGSLAVAMAAMTAVSFGSTLGQIAQLGGAFGAVAGKAGLLLSILGRMGLVGAVGLGAFGVGRAISSATGFDDVMGSLGGKIYDWTHGDPMNGPAAGRSTAAPGGAGIAAKQAQLRALESQFGLPAGLLDSVWKQESSRGADKRTSGAGASGDFQFLPGTANAYGVKDTSDFMQSAQGAARMYADLLKQFHGDVPSALAAYNWGSGNVSRKGLGSAPMETQNYIRQVMGRMQGGGGGGGGTTEVHIAQIDVNTRATDAKGIARDIGGALQNQEFAVQANSGLY